MPRRPLDQYETPPHYVEPLLDLIGPLHNKRVYEPCVGKGHISRFLTDCYLVTNDIDTTCAANTHKDACGTAAWPSNGDRMDWTITNPPFAYELPILLHALQHSYNVAFLARLSFLEPTLDRGPFWRQHPPTDVIVLPRYSFRDNDEGKRQTDSVTCAWLLFRVGIPPCVRFSTWRPGRDLHEVRLLTHSLLPDSPVYPHKYERARCGALINPAMHSLEPTCDVCATRQAEYEALDI